MKTVYHATNNNLTLSKKVKSIVIDISSLEESRKITEELLEGRRPERNNSRLNCWFAFEKIEYAATYITHENRNPPYKIYELKMEESSSHPMYLVDKIRKHILAKEMKLAESLVDEYWMPTQNWKYMEHLAKIIEVVKIVEWPDDVTMAVAFLEFGSEEQRYTINCNNSDSN